MNVVCVGDCGVDRYVSLNEDRPGGIALNFAAHARRLFDAEDRVTVVSAIGDDDEARIVTRALGALPVDAALQRLSGRTSIQTISLEPSGEKTFLAYEQGVLGDYRVGDKERAVIAHADILMAPHYRQIDGFFESVMAAPSRGLRAVDFADIADAPSLANVERFIDRLDVAFLGLRSSHASFIEDVAALAAEADKLIVVTLGPDGSVALSRSGRTTCPAVPVERVVDTTGAGDTFAAGFLSELTVSGNVTKALHRGAAAAAETITRVGAF